MKFRVEIDVMPLEEILDPQGKAVQLGLKNLGIQDVNLVRVGKHITLFMEEASRKAAEEKVELACKKLLSNVIMEGFQYTIVEEA